jgi:radical SAM family uncharacterized protein/radical SAM-linked protein
MSEHPYSAFLHLVEKPARYVGGEYNSVVKERADVRMCLAFPDVYDIGMSHLGTKILYRVVNAEPDLALERAYTPWPDMERELRARGLPVYSLETTRSLSDFDVLGFSLQYEMTYTNVLTMLDLSGIPLRSADRDASHPLIVGGGPTATHPEVVAPFFDVFLVGDAEAALPALLRRVGELRDAGVARADALVALAQLEGIYVPSLYATSVDARSDLLCVDEPLHPDVPALVSRAFVEDINRYPFPSDSPEPVAEAIFDRVSVEIARGCTEGCRFCQAGMIYRPVRERAPEQVIDTIVAAVEKGGYDEASLTCLSTADYSCVSPLIKRVMEKLRPRNVSLSVSSLRAYGLDEDLLDEMASVRATGLTFAPEAGTQRMRDVVNKNIDEDDIFATCHRVFERGWKRVKLYFMIGLPTETDEDVAGIAEMGRQALDIGRGYQRNVQVTVSVSSHVPKPHTPFQWAAMDALEEIDRKQGILWHLARRYGLNFRKHDMRVSHLEGILARGDRRVADLIELAWRKGARFDGWDELLAWDAWLEAIAEWEAAHGISRSLFLSTIPVDGRLPWDHIDVGLEDGFLAKEYKKALGSRLSPPCGKPVGAKVHHTNLADADADDRKLVCYHCGVACDLTQMRQERKDFLTTLGAEARLPRSEEPTERDRAHERFRRGLTPRELDQGDFARYRLRFTKLGQVALQGQLDVVRMLPRLFRRAGIGLAYSEGFHPKPVLQYGPALALGVLSVAEYAELRLREALDADEVWRRLEAVAPAGLRILGVEAMPEQAPKLSKVLHVEELLLTQSARWFETHHPDRDPVAVVAERCAEFLARDSLLVTRAKKDRTQHVEVRAGVLDATAVPRSQWPALLGIHNPVGVRILAPIDSSGTRPKPSELSEVLFGEAVPNAYIARTEVYTRTNAGALEAPVRVRAASPAASSVGAHATASAAESQPAL